MVPSCHRSSPGRGVGPAARAPRCPKRPSGHRIWPSKRPTRPTMTSTEANSPMVVPAHALAPASRGRKAWTERPPPAMWPGPATAPPHRPARPRDRCSVDFEAVRRPTAWRVGRPWTLRRLPPMGPLLGGSGTLLCARCEPFHRRGGRGPASRGLADPPSRSQWPDPGRLQIAGDALPRRPKAERPRSTRPHVHLGRPWEHLGRPWEHLGRPWGHLGRPWEHLGRPWARSGMPS